MGLYLPVIENADYTGPSITAHPYIHECNVFFPNYIDGVKDESIVVPPNGFPVIVCPQLTAFSTTSMLSQINENGGNIFAFFLRAGYVVVLSKTTVSLSDTIGQLQGTDGGILGQGYPGNGVMLPVNSTPAGYTGSGQPMKDPLRHNPLRDMVMISQYTKALADSRDDMDSDKMICRGSSASGFICAWLLWGTDRSTQVFDSPSGQELIDTSTIYKGGLLKDAPAAWWPIYKQNGVGVNSGVRAYGFSVDQSGGGAWDDPAINFEDTLNTQQSSLSGINQTQVAGSNATNVLTRMVYGEQGFATNPPYLFDNTVASSNVELTAHSPWHGQTAKAELGDAVQLVLTSNQALVGFETTSLHDELILTGVSDQQDADVAAFNELLDWTFPYEPPSGTNTALSAPAKTRKTYVELTWGDDFVVRVTDSDNDEMFQANSWQSEPTMSIDFPPNSMSLVGKTLGITMDEPDSIEELTTGSIQTNIGINVYEHTYSDDFPNGKILHLFQGKVDEFKQNFNGNLGELYIEASPKKNQRDILINTPATLTCQNKLFSHPCRNTETEQGPIREDYEEEAEVSTITGNKVTLIGLLSHQNFPDPIKYWYKGSITYRGISILIRAWNPEFPSEFLTARKIPDSWFGKTVTVIPGCAKIIEQCRVVYSGESNFNALGHLMPTRDPTTEI